MADYYTQTSFILPLEENQKEKALNIIERKEKQDYLCFEFEEQEEGVWFHGQNIDIEELVDTIQMVLDELSIMDEIRFSWAEYCNKPRLDSFGGGACKLKAGEAPVIVWASECL